MSGNSDVTRLRVPENLAPFIPEILAGLVPNSSTN